MFDKLERDPASRESIGNDRTFVPPDMMREGWTAEHPCTRDGWCAERDVFTWFQFNSTIEDVIAMYQRWLDEAEKVEKKGFLSRALSIFTVIQYGRCHHNVNTWAARCAICESQHRECIAYLIDLKAKMKQRREPVEPEMIPDDPYALLAVGRGATARDIKRAFRRLALKYHPDHNPGDSLAEERFKRISQAYEILSGKRIRR